MLEWKLSIGARNDLPDIVEAAVHGPRGDGEPGVHGPNPRAGHHHDHQSAAGGDGQHGLRVDGHLHRRFSKTLAATGGTAPYTAWAITVGALPGGLSLSTPGGVISGTPSASGTFTYTARVTDTAAATATQSYTQQIIETVTFTTTSPLPAATVNTAYSLTFAYTGGQTPFTCSVTAGSLPTGLSLDASTCVLSGTPTIVSGNSFSIRVAETLGSTSTLACSLTVAAETLPPGRPVKTGSVALEAAVFRRGTAPTAADNVVAGPCRRDIN